MRFAYSTGRLTVTGTSVLMAVFTTRAINLTGMIRCSRPGLNPGYEIKGEYNSKAI